MAPVSKRYVLSEYVELAISQATYDKLGDASFSGRIPTCPGVLSFAPTLKECEQELRSTLEDWVLLGLKLRHHLPVIGDIDLNKEPVREPVDAL
jgi:predicted RNase H-like HicB family nuclease